ncbi:hypothetical protein ACFYY2_12035 [Streptomyces sp. NPDC001822]|uniref:hypothetical protein n=1 Tax=Streptomyces sp. NPDC001822 TaxID=3364614 RepID=UPI003686487A
MGSHRLYVPRIGDIVKDSAKKAPAGTVMGHEGPYYQLRPLGGGKEWDARPEDIEPVPQIELLSLRAAEATRRGLQDS